MERSYYQQYYELERTHWWFVVRAAIITLFFRKNIGARPGMKIANIGVATGRTSELLSQWGEVTSVEPDKECCKFLREELNMQITEASATRLPFESGKFDVVCAFDVLEHIEDHTMAMQELRRIVKDDGWIMITVPAYNWLWSDHDEVNHHFRRYSRKQIAGLVANSGCKIHYQTGFNFLLFLPIAAFHLLSRLTKRKKRKVRSNFEIMDAHSYSFVYKILKAVFSLEKIILPITSLPFGVSFLVMARKK